MTNMGKRLLHVLAFVASLLATGIWIRSIDRLPFWSYQRGRYILLHERLDEFDTIFVGSSRLNFALIPAVFDARMRELGRSVHSLNLAISGQRGFDTAATIEHLLQLAPKNLRCLVIELHSFDQRIRGTNWVSDLDVEMHPVSLLWARLCSALDSGCDWRSVVDQVHFLVAHTAANAFRVGQGGRLIDDLLAAASGRRLWGAGKFPNRGFDPADRNAGADMREAAKRFAEEPDRPKQLLNYRFSKAALDKLLGGFPVDEFFRIDARVREAGIEPIYVVMPSYYSAFFGYDAIPELARRTAVVDLDQPERHPLLFEPSMWFDPGHFGRAGAGVFTRYLAERVAELPRFSEITAPARPETLQVQLSWLPGAGHMLRCELDDASEGEIAVRIDVTTDETERGDGLAHALPEQAKVTLPLARGEHRRWSGSADLSMVVDGLPPGALVHAQAVRLVNDRMVGVGPLVSLPMPR